MPVARYRRVEDMPSALQGDAGMTPAVGFRLACELSDTALRLSRSRSPSIRVRRRATLVADEESGSATVPADGTAP